MHDIIDTAALTLTHAGAVHRIQFSTRVDGRVELQETAQVDGITIAHRRQPTKTAVEAVVLWRGLVEQGWTPQD